MAEVSGDVLGTAVANGVNSGGGQGLRRTAAAGGGFLWDVKRASYRMYRNTALRKATIQLRKLFCVGKEGQTSRYIPDLINLSYRTT